MFYCIVGPTIIGYKAIIFPSLGYYCLDSKAMSSTTTKRSPPSGISVLISGAGIGGIMAGLELWRIGCEVRILERTEATVTGGSENS